MSRTPEAARSGSGRARTRRAGSDSRRAQMGLDFAVGAGVFLLAVAAVVAFTPAMFDPYADADSDNLAAADRATAHLADGLLAADPAAPSSLDVGCTAALFDEENVTGARALNCSFDPNESLDQLLGVDGNVRASIHPMNESPNNASSLAYGGETVTLDRSADSVPLDVTAAHRIVLLDGERYRLTVRVW